MQYNKNKNSSDYSKKLVIIALAAISICICISGLIFGLYSYINEISFKIINTKVPGVIFGILVVYLGIRYFLSVLKLKTEVYKDTSVFSWSNFKRQKSTVK